MPLAHLVLKALITVLMQAFEPQKSNEKSAPSAQEQFMESILAGDRAAVDLYLAGLVQDLDASMPLRGRSVSPVHLACETGNLEILKRLVDARANVDIKDTNGCTPFYYAAQNGHHSLADFLIKAQADINSTSYTGVTPLYAASQHGHLSIVDLLISAQADLDGNATGRMLATPLHVACFVEHHKIVQSLLRAQADANIAAMQGITALYIASQEGYEQVVRILLTAQETSQIDANLQDTHGCSPLYLASQNGHHRVVKLLCSVQADVNLAKHNGMSCTYVACQNGHDRVLAALVEAMADVDAQECTGVTPLYAASCHGHSQVVKLLIKARANLNTQDDKGVPALLVACCNSHSEVVNLLIEAQADVNIAEAHGESSLYVAAQHGHHSIVSALVRAKADVNVQQIAGATPLFIAAQNGHIKVVNFLIKAGADVNIWSNTGATPIFVASSMGHESVVESLIQAQAEINIISDEEEWPLYIASHQGHTQVVNLLVEAQADVDHTESQGISALHIAAQVGWPSVVEALIKAQANVSATTNSGLSPLHLASYQGHQEVVELLINSQADLCVSNSHQLAASPLMLAALEGHDRVVSLLVAAITDSETRINQCTAALALAQQNDHLQVVDVLEKVVQDTVSQMREAHKEPLESAARNDELILRDGPKLGQTLHEKLSESGFTESRAAMQAAVADVLQETIRKRLQDDEVYVVGSYSESWGNNLSALDGRTDIESDIDVMRLVSSAAYHLRGVCQCVDRNDLLVEYTNGHILCPGFTANPAEPRAGSELKPAVDRVAARPLCCYPPIAPLMPERLSATKIALKVISALQHEIKSSPCHVVHAAPQDEGGKQLRVSTTFLEKCLLRSLSTLQGQLFVILKYIVKKVISNSDHFNLQGLKAYHIKTITFRMLEATPQDQWTPENLFSLIDRSLKMLLTCFEGSITAENLDGRIMNHFFLCDAALYLKGVERKTASEMVEALEHVAKTLQLVINQLPELLMKFRDTLKPLSESETFYFHPFVLLPYMNVLPLPTRDPIEYHEIYDIVYESIILLSHPNFTMESHQRIKRLLGMLPDCALTAREALSTLNYLQIGSNDVAEEVLRRHHDHKVTRGIKWSSKRQATEATPHLVWCHLLATDSAWKFCFEFEEKPRFQSVPRLIAECFPLQMENYLTNFFLNFDALFQCLRLELRVDEDAAHDWIQEVARRDDVDLQELLVAALHCRGAEVKRHFRSKIHNALVRSTLVRGWLLDQIQSWYALLNVQDDELHEALKE